MAALSAVLMVVEMQEKSESHQPSSQAAHVRLVAIGAAGDWEMYLYSRRQCPVAGTKPSYRGLPLHDLSNGLSSILKT
jgi:hypothetical protein